jgi:Parkin co-regulated protein
MTLNKKVRESVMGVLNIIEQQGGKEALEVIRSKIPTYTSIFM